MAKPKKSVVSSQEKEERVSKKEQFIEQRQEKIAAAREALVSGIKALETDEDWKKFLNRLTKRSRFSPARLSFGNQMLVYIQFEEATAVATYRSWYRIGRWPTKGSHGIMIFQPRPYMKKSKDEPQENGNDGEETENGKYKPTGRIFFKPIYLFDISQTEGKDPPDWLKPPPPPKIDNKEIFKNSVEKLAELVEQLPDKPVSKIEIRDRKKGERSDVYGEYYRDTKLIVIFNTDNRGQMFKTLVHEIAHAMMHADDTRPSKIREVEAESVAYVVNKTLGLDTADYSFKYVAGWSGMKEKSEEAIKIVERSGQRIVATCNMILDVLMPLAALPDEDEQTGSPDTPQPVEEPVKRGKGRPKGSKNKTPQPIDISKLVKPIEEPAPIPVIVDEPESINEPERKCEINQKRTLHRLIEFALNNDGYVDDTNNNIISFGDAYKASKFRIKLAKYDYSYTEKKEGKDIIFEITCGTPSITTTSISETTVAEPKPSIQEPDPSKIIAKSFERYSGGAAVKKLYGSSTVTKFYVYKQEDADKPANWKIIEGKGPTPGDRKTFAIQTFLASFGHGAPIKQHTEEPNKSYKVAESKELKRGVDYYADTDTNGEPVNPGDYVSFKTYPKGTGRGIVVISKREMVVLPDGSKLPALAINSDGVLYGYVTGGVKKLKHQQTTKEPEPTIQEPIQQFVGEKRKAGRPKGSKNKPKEIGEPASSAVSAPKAHKGIYYFPSFESAIIYAKEKGFPTDRINQYERGWAIQLRVSGPYVGPGQPTVKESKPEIPTQFKKEVIESKPGLKKESEQTNEPKSRKPRSGAYSLKPGTAFELIGGEWDVSMTDDIAVSTANPIKRQVLDDSECIIFQDAKGRRWAQTEPVARNRNNKRALKQHTLQTQEKAPCVCLGKTSKQAGKTEKDFDKKAIATGVKVELEHTDDIEIAKRITMDHLTEDKDYYTKLIKAGL